MKNLSIVGLAVLLGGVLTLFRLGALLADSPWLIAMQVMALAWMIWARITFGMRSFHATANPTAGGLVTSGPYRFLRHPIYASICLFSVAAVVGHWGAASALALLAILTGVLLRVFAEEHFLRRAYPEYDAYAARTKRIVPLVF